MSRGAWFLAGAGAGVYAVFRGRRAAEILTVDGLTDRINAVALGARLLGEEASRGAAEKESELRERLHLAPSQPRPAIAERPAGPPPAAPPDTPPTPSSPRASIQAPPTTPTQERH